MGYFEGITASSFKKDEDGNTVFYPWGVLGRGRVLTDESTEKQIRNFLFRFYKASFVLIAASAVSVGWQSWVALVPILGGWFYFGSRSIVGGCPYSEEKLTFKAAAKNSAKGHDAGTFWIMLPAFLVLSIGSLVMANTSNEFYEVTMGWGGFVFFGTGAFAFGYMIYIKSNT